MSFPQIAHNLQWFKAVVTEFAFALVKNDMYEMLVRDEDVTRFVMSCRSDLRSFPC